MRDWFNKVWAQIKTVWSKGSLIQKLIFGGILLVAAGALIFVFTISADPGLEALIGIPVTDQTTRDRILIKLDEENVTYSLSADNRIYVKDKETARRMRALLVREDLLPADADPWSIFDTERWTITDFERDVNLQRAITSNLEQHIQSLDDVDSANVTLVLPEHELFAQDQNPVTASVVIIPKPGSDITENRKKIEGIVKLIKTAVEGLLEENITILDHNGSLLNDFEDLQDIDRLSIMKREIKQKHDLENQYKSTILSALRQIYSQSRVEIINLDIDLDLSKKKVSTEEHFPITLYEDDPTTPYSEYQPIESITISKANSLESFEGTGFNPEGPAGSEGQTPPAYKDLEGLVGKYDSTSTTENKVVNTRNIEEEKSPWEIRRVTLAVAIDGVWKWQYDEKGRLEVDKSGSITREYTAVPDEELAKARALVEHAIGFDKARGDSVTVQHLPFDRSSEFKAEDDAYRKQQQLKLTILYSLLGIGVLILILIIFRLISREMERRRRKAEEERLRLEQMQRDQALLEEEESTSMEMSISKRASEELLDQVTSIARDKPEEVALLIRTWLVEE